VFLGLVYKPRVMFQRWFCLALCFLLMPKHCGFWLIYGKLVCVWTESVRRRCAWCVVKLDKFRECQSRLCSRSFVEGGGCLFFGLSMVIMVSMSDSLFEEVVTPISSFNVCRV